MKDDADLASIVGVELGLSSSLTSGVGKGVAIAHRDVTEAAKGEHKLKMVAIVADFRPTQKAGKVQLVAVKDECLH